MTNAQTLGMIVGRFAAPLLAELGGSRLSSVPAVQALENRVRASGWVGAKWTLASELAPFADVVSQAVVGQALGRMLAGVPDEAIPQMAHGIVDKALADGKLELLEGKVTLDSDDLKRLKGMLERNLPYDGQMRLEL